MEEELTEKTEEKIKEILENGIDQNNLDHLYKLSKIRHFIKEEEKMQGNYGNYGNYGYGNYGNYGRGYGEYSGSYGRRGYDAKYRGYDELDRMGEYYGRYMDGYGRYGAEEDAKRNLKSMLECMEQFAKVVKEQAQSPEEQQMVREAAQKIATS